jgi:protein-S-isoprenylcysteine O-methyltransferase Ste14
MLMETIIACFLLACLTVFFSINLHNILVFHRSVDKTSPDSEADYPSGIIVDLAALGTIVYFVEATFYPLFVLANSVSLLSVFTLVAPGLLTPYGQVLGLVLTAFGYFLFLWSVITRGKYATSWTMRENHVLVTWGPYRHVRHPSYLAYFLMFIGLLLVWPSWLSLIPLVAIPAYFSVTFQEEKLLERRFGEEYSEYQSKTGRFVPGLKVHDEKVRNG